ncbi:MerR family transcriptional regulator [Nocardiopsis changdeensis]|uniref:MerR family transcriptional regulator n=1 Tax=Nocardiopsis changdeensis TaxID=2831969 RepID=A0ABX8BQQ2_9ACTN|nr:MULTISPECIES: MerR family transcriptional regulator [Nocardiopsis]QUX22733.1 MerR family transcriptional regulator [Nocardiopsis changdeensis]QYX38676.1 MerR family transcriptional regulator [Nocardiopsis sp. MT53]
MRIGELARRTGASPRSLRYYEDQGLLASTRSPGGHREYAEESVERVERIRCLYAAGLNSETVRGILPCMYANEVGEPAPDLIDMFWAERERIEAAIRSLEKTRASLDAVIGEAVAARAATRPPTAPEPVTLTGNGHTDMTPRPGTAGATRRRP